MNFIQLFIYLIQFVNEFIHAEWCSSIWNHSAMDTFIHVGGFKITLNFKLQAKSFKLKL
jgi:hypothetical protein